MDSTTPLPTRRRDLLAGLLLLVLTLSAIVILAGGVVALAADTGSAATGDASKLRAAMTPGAITPGATPAQPAVSGSAGASADAAPAAAPQAATTDQPDPLLGPEPATRVRVAVLNATGKPGGANKVAVLLGEYKRRALEDQIGLQIEVVNLSTAESIRPGQSILFYRPEFLRAALAMAQAIPGEQFVEPMRPSSMKRAGVDVEIVVGKELP